MLTLKQTEALSFDLLFATLPAATATRLGSLALQVEFLKLIAEDGGLHATHEDMVRAERERDQVATQLERAIWAAFPTLLPDEPSGVYPLWMVLDSREPPATINIRGLGVRELCRRDWGGWFVPDGSHLVEIGGAIDLNGADPEAPRDLLFLTVEDIDAERARLHPELPTPHHVDDSYDDAA